MDALLKLHEKVQAEPLGDKRREIIAEEAPRTVPLGSMPSSYRFNKVKAAKWRDAAEEGTEEQLRITEWMADREAIRSGKGKR